VALASQQASLLAGHGLAAQVRDSCLDQGVESRWFGV
jgi:hypothetical protein